MPNNTNSTERQHTQDDIKGVGIQEIAQLLPIAFLIILVNGACFICEKNTAPDTSKLHAFQFSSLRLHHRSHHYSLVHHSRVHTSHPLFVQVSIQHDCSGERAQQFYGNISLLSHTSCNYREISVDNLASETSIDNEEKSF